MALRLDGRLELPTVMTMELPRVMKTELPTDVRLADCLEHLLVSCSARTWALP